MRSPKSSLHHSGSQSLFWNILKKNSNGKHYKDTVIFQNYDSGICVDQRNKTMFRNSAKFIEEFNV